MENKTLIALTETQVLAEQVQEKPSKSHYLKKYLRKNSYQWHKIIGLISIIPVIFWTLSGFMHPFMAHWFKPKIAREFMMSNPLNHSQITLDIQTVMDKNNLTELRNFRLVSFEGKTYYQIKNLRNDLQYFNAQTGAELPKGDEKYAEWLARYFLDDSQSKIKSIQLQGDFDGQYKFINRLLPVWKVSFERKDGMDVYVETSASRLATFNNTQRKAFLWIFDNFHNWTWIENISNVTVRVFILIAFLSVVILSAVSGLLVYGIFWKRFKKPIPMDKKGILRSYHRQIGLATALVTLTFSFSGAYHATRKLEPNRLPEMVYEPLIKKTDLQTSSLKLGVDWETFINISVVKMRKEAYFQILSTNPETRQSSIQYLHTKNGSELKNGNTDYAKFLANIFENALQCGSTATGSSCCESSTSVEPNALAEATLLQSKVLQKFESREYGFIFKRLPVVQLAYDTPEKTTFYIETATSHLAAKIQNADRTEGYSFAIFHKFLFLDWAGKNVRDIALVISALGVLTVSLLGLALFLRK